MEDYLTQQFRTALARVTESLENLAEDFDPAAVDVEFQIPGNPEHGDLATNLAMQLARDLRKALATAEDVVAGPRQIAESLVEHLDLDPARVASVEVAGPGFINIRFADAFLSTSLQEILEAGEAWGKATSGKGKTALVEYVSANPTGPLTVGHGRNAVLGDTVANLLEATGYDVTREYYFNDAGRQMRVLGESVRARYEALVNPEIEMKTIEAGEGETVEVPASFPDDGYLGAYILDIARTLKEERGDDIPLDDVAPFQEAAEAVIFREITATLRRLGVEMDAHFNERSLYDSGVVWRVVERLREQDLAYDKDGAVWFATGKLGKEVEGEESDVVLVKSSGEPTYRLPDIAYHLNKLNRGYERVIDILGADHIATYPDVVRGVEALGGDASRIEVLVYQFVTLVRSGQPVKMSTRKANYVTLDDLMDEVGEDVARFFFLMRAPGTHLDFDLDLAKEASEKNPVFYLQYAHARICSVQRKAEEVGLDVQGADLSLLTHENEQALVKELLRMPNEVAVACERMEPHKLAVYLRDVATTFSLFYRDCRIIGEEEPLAKARLALAEATRQTLANGLGILGVSAPERM